MGVTPGGSAKSGKRGQWGKISSTAVDKTTAAEDRVPRAACLPVYRKSFHRPAGFAARDFSAARYPGLIAHLGRCVGWLGRARLDDLLPAAGRDGMERIAKPQRRGSFSLTHSRTDRTCYSYRSAIIFTPMAHVCKIIPRAGSWRPLELGTSSQTSPGRSAQSQIVTL